jgi:hypothetical protein
MLKRFALGKALRAMVSRYAAGRRFAPALSWSIATALPLIAGSAGVCCPIAMVRPVGELGGLSEAWAGILRTTGGRLVARSARRQSGLTAPAAQSLGLQGFPA